MTCCVRWTVQVIARSQSRLLQIVVVVMVVVVLVVVVAAAAAVVMVVVAADVSIATTIMHDMLALHCTCVMLPAWSQTRCASAFQTPSLACSGDV